MKSLGPLTLVAFLFAGCSKPSADELYGKAEEAYKLQNYPVAIEYFSRLMETHPEAEKSERAAFNLAAIYNNDTHNFQKAVDAYNRYLSLFPQGKQAPIAQFLAGYIYNNELHKLDSAAIAYKAFLSKYPENEMATSAKFELDNLGKSPADLVPRAMVADQPEKKPAKGKNN